MRCASIWLIRSFVDIEAIFEFISRESEIPEGAIAFVLPKADLNPTETQTTFGMLIQRYDVTDPNESSIRDPVTMGKLRAIEGEGSINPFLSMQY